MYRHRIKQETTIEVNASYEGETIEEKVDRIVNNREPITDGAPIIFTERKDGVPAGYDIRTDRFEVAVEAMDTVTKTFQAKREAKADTKIVNINDKTDSKTESTQGKQSTTDGTE